ncbi:MAG: MerR family transcriptional regulator [Gaiellaceae bacterium]
MAGVYSIGSAARLLHVPPATIRTWEKRYGIVVPQRTNGGQRLYSQDQLEQLRFVVSRIGAGMRPGEAHRLLRESATSLELELACDLQAPGVARRAVEPLAQSLPDDVSFNLRLLVSELVANSVRHAGLNGGGTVRIRARLGPDRVHVEVHDGGTFDWRAPGPRAVDAEGRRGLPLVAALSSRWGLTFDDGTTAWFELPRAT